MAVAGEIEPRQDQLLAEAARLGQDFGLGPCTAARTAKRRPWQFGCGGSLLMIAAGLGLPLLFSVGGVARAIIAIVGGGLAVAGLVMMVVWQQENWDRLFRYDVGLAQVVRGEPEPLIVRWEDLVAVGLGFGRDDDSWDISGCAVTPWGHRRGHQARQPPVPADRRAADQAGRSRTR